MNNHSDELQHYGVPGMKWGHRKSVYSSVSGAIRRKQMSNANRRLIDIQAKQKQVNSELRELNSYEKNPSKMGSSKISTAIRRNQIKSLNKTKAKLNEKASNNMDALKELRSIDRHAKRKDAIREARAQEKYDKLVKDNDRRVKLYGKKNIQVADAIHIGSTLVGMKVGMNVVKAIGTGAMKGIAENPKIGNGALHATSALTVAGMGAVAVSSLKRANALGRDIKLAGQYNERQYYKKMAKKK